MSEEIKNQDATQETEIDEQKAATDEADAATVDEEY